MSVAEVRSFLETYRDAFDRLDGDAVADLWHLPCGIAGASGTTFWNEDAPMRANMRALCELYRGCDYARAEFTLGDWVPLGADHAFAGVRWTLWRSDGSLLQQFHTGYNLRRTAQGPKVLLCTAYEEDIAAMKRHADD